MLGSDAVFLFKLNIAIMRVLSHQKHTSFRMYISFGVSFICFIIKVNLQLHKNKNYFLLCTKIRIFLSFNFRRNFFICSFVCLFLVCEIKPKTKNERNTWNKCTVVWVKKISIECTKLHEMKLKVFELMTMMMMSECRVATAMAHSEQQQ